MQKEINYADIVKLGFKETLCDDTVFFDRHGYDYKIITFNLTKYVYLEWTQTTRLVEMVRINKKHDIIKRKQVMDFDELSDIVDFWKGA